MPTPSQGALTPTHEVTATVRTLLKDVGLPEVQQRLSIGRDSVMRIAAGLPVRRSTLLVVSASLEGLTKA